MVIPSSYRQGDDSAMDNKAVRHKNIEALVAAHGGPTAFGALVLREQVQVSQWLGGKPIGDQLARHIEKSLKKPTGWLDSPQWLGAENASAGASQSTRLDLETILITTRALMVVLRRRDPDATLDLENREDAELFATVYAEALGSDDELTLGAVVADLVQEREARRGRKNQQAGGTDRGKARKQAARS